MTGINWQYLVGPICFSAVLLQHFHMGQVNKRLSLPNGGKYPNLWQAGIVWFCLGVLNGSALYMYWSDAFPGVSQRQDVVFGLFVSNVFVNAMWRTWLYDRKNPAMAKWFALLAMGTAVPILALFGLQGSESKWMTWVGFGIFCPYVLYTIYMIYLSMALQVDEMPARGARGETAPLTSVEAQ